MTKNNSKTRAEEISAAQMGNDDAAARLSEKAAEKQRIQNAHDDVITGRVRVSEVVQRAGLLADKATAEENANAREKRAKPATGTALTVCGLLKAGKYPHEVVALEGVARIDRLHFILTEDGRAGYRFTLVTSEGAGETQKTVRTNIEVINGGERTVDTVSGAEMKASQDNATPSEMMRAAITKAEAKGKLSARLASWKATLEGAANASA